jgi:AcrR family transcriptional regulator
VSLRELKKERTRKAISTAAITLFLAHGYDEVSISQIADAAEVSRRTLFAYFPTKEDLVVHRFADHETESGRVVRQRPDGQSPLAALRERYLDGLRARDPITGLCDMPEVVGLFRMLLETPALAGRMLRFISAGERALADALRDTAGASQLTAALAAAQIAGVQWALSLANQAHVTAGVSVDDAYPEALRAAEEGFRLLGDGLSAAGLATE